jgi:hypothetical protein
MKLLSVCIPTYNRSSYVIYQLEFIRSELIGFEHLIDICVSDNNSNQDHTDKLLSYHEIHPFFKLTVQKSNLGLIGNIYELLAINNSKYIWFIGDDDILLKNIFKTVIQVLGNSNDLNLVLLNHQGFIGNQYNIVSSFDTLGFEGRITDGKKCIIKLFEENYTALMFITSNIFRVEILKNNFQNKTRNKLIEDPLLFAFVSASLGEIYLIKDIFVLDRFANASWKKNSAKIFAWGVPNALLNLYFYNFSKDEIKELLTKYYNNFLGSYIRMMILSPFSIRIQLIFNLGFKNLLLFSNSLRYLYERYSK